MASSAVREHTRHPSLGGGGFISDGYAFDSVPPLSLFLGFQSGLITAVVGKGHEDPAPSAVPTATHRRNGGVGWATSGLRGRIRVKDFRVRGALRVRVSGLKKPCLPSLKFC